MTVTLTNHLDLPFPAGDENAFPPEDFEALAERLEVVLARIRGIVGDAADPDPGELIVVDGSSLPQFAALSGDATLSQAGALTIVNNAITAAKISANAVTSSKIQDNAVTNAKLADDAVTAAEIAADAVGTTEIATDAVTSAEIAADAVGTAEIATDAVTAAEIAANAVGTSEIASGAVGASELADNAVDTGAIQDLAVTMAKIQGPVTDLDAELGTGGGAANTAVPTTMADLALGAGDWILIGVLNGVAHDAGVNGQMIGRLARDGSAINERVITSNAASGAVAARAGMTLIGTMSGGATAQLDAYGLMGASTYWDINYAALLAVRYG